MYVDKIALVENMIRMQDFLKRNDSNLRYYDAVKMIFGVSLEELMIKAEVELSVDSIMDSSECDDDLDLSHAYNEFDSLAIDMRNGIEYYFGEFYSDTYDKVSDVFHNACRELSEDGVV